MKVVGTMPNGKPILLYELENNSGMRAEICSLGGAIISLWVPDADGNLADVVLGHPNIEDYILNPFYFGALVGRNTNRIAGSTCMLDGVIYELDKNDGENNLHGGSKGLTYRLMEGELLKSEQESSLRLTCQIPHLSDGFPGNLDVVVTYTLQQDNVLVIDYEAVSDAETIINLTNHSYFNLSGHNSGSIKEHIITMDTPFYNPNDEECVPTGELLKVENTPFDMESGIKLGDGIESGFPQINMFNGYDHNVVLPGRGWRVVCKVEDPISGRVMEVLTTQSNIQLYTHNQSISIPGKNGACYEMHQGFTMETQTVPNGQAMPWMLSPIYKANDIYKERTAFRFKNLKE